MVNSRIASVIDDDDMNEAISQIRFMNYRLAATTESDFSDVR